MSVVALFIGVIIGCLLPVKVQGWVRGVAGKARGLVLGAAPASNVPSSKEDSSPASTAFIPDKGRDEVSPSPPNKPIEAIKGFLAGVGNMASFVIRHPVLLIGIALVAFWLIAGSSCARLPFGKSNDALRIERELAEANATVKAHEARLAELSRDLAVNTERDRNRRAQVVAQTEQEIENAAAQVDPFALSDAYERGYVCMLDASACASRSDPAPSRSAPVRGASADPV